MFIPHECSMYGACGGQKALDPVELQLQAVVNFRVCWELFPGPMQEQSRAFNPRTIYLPQSPFIFFQNFNSNYLVL